MKLYTFDVEGRTILGAERDGDIVDLAATWVASGAEDRERAYLADMLSFVRGGDAALDAARRALDVATRSPSAPGGARLAYRFGEVRLRPPLPAPGKVLCSGLNYHSHTRENPAARLPSDPFFFAKLPNTIAGPGDPIVKPRMTGQLDYEVELAVVVGRRMRNTPEGEVMGCVAGYTILHDVSARDVQFKDNQITLGKNFDTFAPMGPCLVTADEIPDPGDVHLRARVNDELRQDGSTADWIFPLPRLLSFLSRVMTLEPGDVVSTGTPAGVGAFRQPPTYLQPGDRVRLEVEGIGVLENVVVEEE